MEVSDRKHCLIATYWTPREDTKMLMLDQRLPLLDYERTSLSEDHRQIVARYVNTAHLAGIFLIHGIC